MNDENPAETVREEILEKVTALLAEHFEGYILSVEVEEDETTSTHTLWNGGLNRALGMAHLTTRRIELCMDETEFPAPPDDDEGDEWKALV
jgi:hypothetical protein